MRWVCLVACLLGACEYQNRGFPDEEDPVELSPDAEVADPPTEPPEPPTEPPPDPEADAGPPAPGDAEFGDPCEDDLDCEDPDAVCARVRGVFICTYPCERKQDCPGMVACDEKVHLCYPSDSE